MTQWRRLLHNEMTLAAIGLFLANVWGYIVAHWRWFLYGFLAIALLLLVVFAYRGCSGRSKAKLDEKAIQEGENAVKERNDAKLKEILANADAREEVIAGNVANAERETEKAKAEAKKKYDAMTTDELAAELEKRK